MVGGFFRRFLGSAISNAAGYGVGGAILPTLQPYTQDLANETWSLHSVHPMSATAAAEAALRGHMSDEDAAREASYTGFNGTRYNTLRTLAGSPPPLETLLTLRRRGVIGDDQLDAGIRQAGYLPSWRPRLRELLPVLPSVTDLIRMAVREVFDPGQRAALDLDADYPSALTDQGAAIGLEPSTLRNYWAAHWELPSYTQGAEMLFRGEITDGQFDGLLRALDYAPVWREPLQAIARAIPSMSDMVRFAVREVYNPPQRSALGLDAEYPEPFTAQARKHGLAEQDARDYWAAHWRLPSATQGYHMLWRGEIDEGELDGLLKALDYPPRWREPLANIARIVPGRIDLKRMLKLEILDRGEVAAGYRRLGYSPQDADRMTDIAVHEMESSESGSPWASRARSRLYTVTHDEYLDDSISEGQATAMLARVGALPAERSTIIDLWDAEASVARRELTPAQIRKAFTKELYTRDRARAALEAAGMSGEDADTFLDSGS